MKKTLSLFSIRDLIKASLITISVLFVSASVAVADNANLIMATKIDGVMTLDPAQINEIMGAEYIGNVYRTLVSTDDSEELKIQPEIAESWQIVKHPAGGTSIIFKLKKHLRFASNNQVTSSDVVFSIHRALQLNQAAAALLAHINLKTENVTAINNYTVRIDTDYQYSPTFILNVLASPSVAIVDKKLVLQNEVDNDLGSGWLKKHSAGSGAFVLEDWQANQYMKLAKNKYYEYKDAVKLDSVVIKHIPESATQKLMISKGDIDIARDVVDLEQLPVKTHMQHTAKAEVSYLALNLQHPALAQEKVRTAMKYLIDYQEIEASIMKYRAVAHQSFIPKRFLGFNGSEPFAFNLTKAKKLLAEAGYPNGFEIELDAENIELAQAIQAYFSAAKIRVKILPGDSKQVITKYRKSQHQIALVKWASDYLDPHYNASNFISSDPSQKMNLAWRNNWKSQELTDKIDQASKAKDNFTRVKLYGELQDEFFKTAPFIVLFQSNSVSIVRDNVSGFKLGMLPSQNKYEFIKKA